MSAADSISRPTLSRNCATSSFPRNPTAAAPRDVAMTAFGMAVVEMQRAHDQGCKAACVSMFMGGVMFDECHHVVLRKAGAGNSESRLELMRLREERRGFEIAALARLKGELLPRPIAANRLDRVRLALSRPDQLAR